MLSFSPVSVFADAGEAGDVAHKARQQIEKTMAQNPELEQVQEAGRQAIEAL